MCSCVLGCVCSVTGAVDFEGAEVGVRAAGFALGTCGSRRGDLSL